MMIPEEHILLDASAQSKRSLLTEMVGLFEAMDPDAVLELIMARERLGSTGIGYGVAIPHSRMPDLARPVLAFARHQAGVDFESHDNQKVHLVLMLLVPDDDSKQHLELLAYLAKKLKRAEFRQSLKDAQETSDIVALFKQDVPLES